jgi:hypothetical protein
VHELNRAMNGLSRVIDEKWTTSALCQAGIKRVRMQDLDPLIV